MSHSLLLRQQATFTSTVLFVVYLIVVIDVAAAMSFVKTTPSTLHSNSPLQAMSHFDNTANSPHPGWVNYELCSDNTLSLLDRHLRVGVSSIPLVRGQDLMPGGMGTLLKDIPAGFFSVTVESDDASAVVYEHDFDLCSIEKLGGCPIPAGMFIVDGVSLHLPADFPLGTMTVTFKLLDGNKATMACIRINIGVIDPTVSSVDKKKAPAPWSVRPFPFHRDGKFMPGSAIA